MCSFFSLGFLRVADSFGGEGFTVIHCSAGVGRTGLVFNSNYIVKSELKIGNVFRQSFRFDSKSNNNPNQVFNF